MSIESAVLNLSKLLHQAAELKTQGELIEQDLKHSENWQGLEFSGPVEWELTINPVGSDDFWLKGSIKGTVILECSRCLTKIPTKIESEMMNVLHFDPNHKGMDFSYDETGEIAVFGQSRMNFMQLFAEAFLINVPLSTLCKSDCRGLCSECGINLNDVAFQEKEGHSFITECPSKMKKCPNLLSNKEETNTPFSVLKEIELE